MGYKPKPEDSDAVRQIKESIVPADYDKPKVTWKSVEDAVTTLLVFLGATVVLLLFLSLLRSCG